jgi:hypothetical protein
MRVTVNGDSASSAAQARSDSSSRSSDNGSETASSNSSNSESSSSGSSSSSSSSSNNGNSSSRSGGSGASTLAAKPEPSIAVEQQRLQRQFAKAIRKFTETSDPQLLQRYKALATPTEQQAQLQKLFDRACKLHDRLYAENPSADQLLKWRLQDRLPRLLADVNKFMVEHSIDSSNSASISSTSSSSGKTGKLLYHAYITSLLMLS